MHIRRSAPVALALTFLATACQEVTQEAPPAEIVLATFSSPNIPLPNDLALQAAPTLAADAAHAAERAQKRLLQSFIAAGGFPSDQEVPVTFPISAYAFDAATSTYVRSSVALDLTTVTPATVALLKADGATPTAVDFDVAGFANGVLTLRKRADSTGSRRWAPGRYVVALRGGANGVKTTTGHAVQPDQAIALTLQNRDLSVPDYQPPGGLSAAQVAQLEGVRRVLARPVAWSNVGGAWTPVPASGNAAYARVEQVFPRQEIASITTFTIAPAEPVVLIDSGSGVAPLPIDLLRTGANGTITSNPAFGSAAAGLATLDGFSTTAMILAQTSVPVDASTVNGANVHLFKVSGGTATRVKELKQELGLLAAGAGGTPTQAGYVAEPTPIVIAQGASCPIAGGCSPAIGLQPATLAPTPAGTFTLPPLEESTTYAVVVTRRVKDVLGRPLGRPTVGKILLDQDATAPVYLETPGVSLLSGVDVATAKALQTMRGELAPVLAALPTGTTVDDVAVAYTFKTQSVTGTSLRLAAAPYAIEAGANQPMFQVAGAPTPVTPPNGVPTTGVAGFYDVPFVSVDGTDKTTGALRPTLSADLASQTTLPTLLTTLHALVVVPNAAAVPACPSPPFPAGARCAKLVVFGHGINGNKETLFATAASLASRGFIAAAVDFPMHGRRNWCRANTDCVNPTSGADGTCTPFEGSAGQGDASPPGVCTGGSVPKPGDSHYFVSANFFRIRDAFRQNVLDQSAMVLALARPPTGVPQLAAPSPLSAVLPAGVVVDPSAVYYEGLSLGAIAGTSVVATNPRITRAAMAVGGGTFADIAISSPAFQAQLAPMFGQLLGVPSFSFDMVNAASPSFNPTVAQGFLRLVNVAKWILDPGEAVNYAPHVRTAPLPNLLASQTGTVAQTPKDVWGQISTLDQVVPNAQNALLYSLIGGPQTVYASASATNGAVSHGILATSAVVQTAASGYLFDLTAPAATVTLP